MVKIEKTIKSLENNGFKVYNVKSKEAVKKLFLKKSYGKERTRIVLNEEDLGL